MTDTSIAKLVELGIVIGEVRAKLERIDKVEAENLSLRQQIADMEKALNYMKMDKESVIKYLRWMEGHGKENL